MILSLIGFSVITKMFLSFIKNYRGTTLRSPCDVITMKNTVSYIIWDDLFIVSYLVF